MKVRLLIVGIFVLGCVLRLFELAGAQSSVPYNGSFVGSGDGWAWIKKDNGGGSSFWTGAGYGGGAGMHMAWQDELLSLPLIPSATSSLTFYANGTSGSGVHVYVWNYSTGVVDFLCGPLQNGTWILNTCDLSGYAGLTVALGFVSGGTMTISQVSVSNAVNVPLSASWKYINGSFDPTPGIYKWVGKKSSALDGLACSAGGTFGYDNSVWHTGEGSLSVFNCPLLSFPFYGGLAGSFWYKASWNEPLAWKAVFYDGVTAAYTLASLTQVYDGEWHSVGIDVSGLSGLKVAFYAQVGSTIKLDDICPTSGCGGWDSPTVTPTSAYPGFPTQAPYPTFPPWPTAGPVALGTICPSNAPCYVTALTPLPVIVNGGTPLFPYGKDTPVPIKINTPEITAVNPGDAGSFASIGGVVATRDLRANTSGVIPHSTSGGGGKGFSDWVGATVEDRSISFCFPDAVQQVIAIESCFEIPVFEVTGLKLLGVDLVPYFVVVSGVLFVVFIIRQIQER